MNGVNEGDNCAAPMQQPHAKYDGNYTMTNAGVLHVRETGTTDVICVYCTAKIGELPNSHHHLDTGSNVTSFPRTNISWKKDSGRLPIFSDFGIEGIFSLLFVSRTKTRLLRTRVDLFYHCGPFPACVGEVFQHLWVQSLFLRTFEDILNLVITGTSHRSYSHGYSCIRWTRWTMVQVSISPRFFFLKSCAKGLPLPRPISSGSDSWCPHGQFGATFEHQAPWQFEIFWFPRQAQNIVL